MTYTAIYERDESGAWIVRIKEIRGCHSYGRSLSEARRRIREALGLFVDQHERARIDDDVRLPPRVKSVLRAQLRARSRLARVQAETAASTARVARVLTRELGLSVRDAGDLLGLSHQRVQQLLGKAA